MEKKKKTSINVPETFKTLYGDTITIDHDQTVVNFDENTPSTSSYRDKLAGRGRYESQESTTSDLLPSKHEDIRNGIQSILEMTRDHPSILHPSLTPIDYMKRIADLIPRMAAADREDRVTMVSEFSLLVFCGVRND